MSGLFRRHLLKVNLILVQYNRQFYTGTKAFAKSQPKSFYPKPKALSKPSYPKPNTLLKSSYPIPKSSYPKRNPSYPLLKTSYPNHTHPKKPDKPVDDVKPYKRKHRSFALFEKQTVKLAPKLDQRPKQKFDYFLVLDFEATCESPGNLDPQEIIEFPVLKVNPDTFDIESTFHSYVRPELYPVLTPFCTELTGVIQSMVENEPLFKEVFENFQQWLLKENLLKDGVKFAFATCGDPDLDYLLPLQCRVSGIEVPEYTKQWINVKRSFCEISPYTWPDNLQYMMDMCELTHSGDLHSGIDDATNVVKVMADLADRGLVFDINGWI